MNQMGMAPGALQGLMSSQAVLQTRPGAVGPPQNMYTFKDYIPMIPGRQQQPQQAQPPGLQGLSGTAIADERARLQARQLVEHVAGAVGNGGNGGLRGVPHAF